MSACSQPSGEPTPKTPPKPTASTHHVDASLEEYLRFERFLADTTALFMSLPVEGVDEALENALRGLVEVLGVDRTSIARTSVDPPSIVVTHTYAAPRITPQEIGVNMAPIAPWYAAQVCSGQRLVLPDLPADVPAEAGADRAAVIAIGMRSHLSLPMRFGDETVGALSVATFREHRWFSAEFVRRLELLASVFAGVLQRRTAQERLRSAQQLNRAVLASVTSEIVVLDAEGHIIAVNHAWETSARGERFPASRVSVGADYVQALARASRDGIDGASEGAAGVRSVLRGESARFDGSYGYPHSSGTRFYLMSATPLSGAGGGGVVVHTDVTDLERSKRDLEKAKENLERALQEVRELKERLEAENVVLHQEFRRALGFDEIVGTSPALARVLREAEQVAPTDAPVLILGETGSGKDLVALAIHERSLRKDRPLVTVNCAALPSTLMESELFGYEKGAFTGAMARTLGRFEVAHGGAILLDEIGELPLEVQAKLLRVLQTGELERLGSSKTVRVDVRLIAATNRDLEKEVQAGGFRADLYYRLNVFPITVPPLRDRPDDIPLLVWHFITKKQVRLGRSIERVPERLMKKFARYSWPGNIRELENVVERALIVSTGPTLETPPSFVDAVDPKPPAREGSRLEDVEREHIRAVLASTGWKLAGRGNAAERLGLNRSTLHARMKKLGIRRPSAAG